MASGVDTSKYTNTEPVYVIFNSTGLGSIEAGGATVSIETSWVPITSDQTGTYEHDYVFNGSVVTAECQLKQVEDIANWKVAFPAGEIQNDGGGNSRFTLTQTPDGTNPATTLATAPVGWKATTALAAKLLFTPVKHGGDAQENDADVWFPKAFCQSVGSIVFSSGAVTTLPLTWRMLYVHNATEAEHIMIRGLATGTWNKT